MQNFCYEEPCEMFVSEYLLELIRLSLCCLHNVVEIREHCVLSCPILTLQALLSTLLFMA